MTDKMRVWRRAMSALVVSALPGWSISAQLAFTDQSKAVGLDLLHEPSANYPQPMVKEFTSGGAVGDFNRDGWQDVFIPSDGTNPDRLCLNNGDGTMTETGAQWGLTELHLGSGIAVGDFNNDGWPDVYVTSFGPSTGEMVGHHRLYRNNAGASFTNVAAAAGVNVVSSDVADGMGAAWGDYDADGDLDLFVTGWRTESSNRNKLFRNNGDETFTDATAEAGIAGVLSEVRGFGGVFSDMDGDRDLELLVIGDVFTSKYLINNGDGTFSDFTSGSGTALEAAGMGQDIGDFNNDQLLDWYVTTINWSVIEDGNRLYINQGGNIYAEIGEDAGVYNGGWGWGTVAVDFDHDGLTDLAETNGWYTPEHENFPSRMWLNNGDLTFDEVAQNCGFIHTGQGRGLLHFDYDNDGDRDVLIFAHAEPLTLFRNDLSGPDTNWLRVALDTSASPTLAPDGYGSTVRATFGATTCSRLMCSGTHFLSQSEASVHFGLGAADTIDELRVEWPNGLTTILNGVAANQTIVVRPSTPATLADFTVAFGTWLSGGLPELEDSDDARLIVRSRPGFTALEPNLVDLRVGLLSDNLAAGALHLAVEMRLNQAGGTARLRIRNWTSGSFDLLDTSPINQTDEVFEVNGIDADDHVRQSDGRIEVSVRTSVIATFSALGFRTLVDQLGVNVE